MPRAKRADPAGPADRDGTLEGQSGRASELRRRYAMVRAASGAALSGEEYDTKLIELLGVAVPSFCDWCAIDLANENGELRPFAVRHSGCEHPDVEGLLEECCVVGLHERVPELEAIANRVHATGLSEVWPAGTTALPWCIVVALWVYDLPFATMTFVTNEDHPGYGPVEVVAAEDVAWATATAIERLLLHEDARDAVRHTQRIASQLHQLIATSITVGTLRTEQDILKSLAGSTRSVFDADTAIVSLESGPAAPLRGLAQRGQSVVCVTPKRHEVMEELPSSRTGGTVPWREGDWLVAPILERRDRARGVVAIERQSNSEFATEDKEVLTLLAQMAATALGAVELSRTIEHSEARWRILVETAPVGIVEVGAQGGVRWWNRGAARIFNWPEYGESLGGEGPFFPDAALERLQALWSDVLEGDFALGRDLSEIEIRGRRRDLTASAALLASNEGAASTILTLIDDVTDHRELKAELRHAHQMEIRGQVASTVAHDFNNLLTLISGYAEILSNDVRSDERASQMVKDIQATTSRASLLTEQLQTIGRTKAPEPVVLRPEEAIQSVAEVLERIVGVDIEVRWSLENNSANVRVDADQFEQMILNLALNARDAMPLGGQLSISVDPVLVEGDQTLALNVPAGNYVLIGVADTGVGMDEETRRRCFEPLFTTKGPFKGTGLGLASARRLVEESAGSIQVRSEVGRGTTFEIFLPAVDELAGSKVAASGPSTPRGSATVLLAEDDEGLRRLVSQVLERNGYLVLEADSAEQAIKLAASFEGTIDLLLSDVVMGELSGIELAANLQGANPSLRVVLMSGSADESILEELLAGSSAFLAKPFRPSALIDQIHELLARRDSLAAHPSLNH
ncbi:MAG: ATP-binding protein [Acidimicrobiales bacterium]